MEIYKPIRNYLESYEISNFGNVKNIRTKKILKPLVKNKREYIKLYKNQIGEEKNIDELVCSTFYSHYNGEYIQITYFLLVLLKIK